MLASYEKDGRKFYIAGAPIEHYDFIGMIRKDQMIFVPIITFLLILTTLVIYRSMACVILSMSIVFMTLVWSMGTISLLGQEINLVTSLLAPVIMIITVVNAIHLMNLFFEIRTHHTSCREAVVLTVSELGLPCFLTHFTTILGFLSLSINPVPAIRSFGLFAAMGTLYSYLIGMLLTPLLLPMLPYRFRDVDSEHFFNRVVIGYLEKLEFRWKWWIMGGMVAMIVFSILGIQKLTVDTSLIKQMKPETPLAIATKFIDDNLTGVYSLGFMLTRKDGSDIVNHETLSRIDEFKEYLETLPEIVKVNTVTTLIKKIHMARKQGDENYKIPEESSQLERYFKGLRDSEDPELWKLMTKDLKQVRLEARMKAVGTHEGALMEERIRKYLHDEMSEDYEYVMTGNIVLLGNMAKNVVANQLKGFRLAFISILILIVIMFRSVVMAIFAAIPSLLPILTIYGIMGYIQIELSTPTAMISSIVLGLVVDSAIHFLHRFRIEFDKRHHYIQALHHTFRNVGQSLVVSTLILCIGFASSVFSSFRPTMHLGVLTSITIFVALVCTLIILPVCIVVLRPFW